MPVLIIYYIYCWSVSTTPTKTNTTQLQHQLQAQVQTPNRTTPDLLLSSTQVQKGKCGILQGEEEMFRIVCLFFAWGIQYLVKIGWVGQQNGYPKPYCSKKFIHKLDVRTRTAIRQVLRWRISTSFWRASGLRIWQNFDSESNLLCSIMNFHYIYIRKPLRPPTFELILLPRDNVHYWSKMCWLDVNEWFEKYRWN